jgi:hypothetical protein
LQQTPCAQKPELQSDAEPHVDPTGFFPQLFPMQRLPPVQSAGAAQLLRQVPAAPHT